MKSQPLVCQYFENISRTAFGKYQALLRAYVRNRHGVYALYKNGRLYYVGLASNLRGRLQTHLRGPHGDSWDRFSVYLTIGDSHIRELESLILRIVSPRGNKQTGKFVSADDLRGRFIGDVRKLHKQELHDLIGWELVSKQKDDRRPTTQIPVGRQAVLSPFVSKEFELRGSFRGKPLRARVLKNGVIRFQGKTFTSPSVAANTICGFRCNGWLFWRYERAPGDWVLLNTMRQ